MLKRPTDHLKAPLPHRMTIFFALVFAAATSGGVHAQTYEGALQAARKADAQFAAMRAGVDGRRAQARQAGTAYYPSGAVNYNQADVTANGRSTRSVSITQPLISYDRYLTLQQADPIAALAEAELAQAHNDLALRVFTAMADVVRNREQIRALTVQIGGLEEQLRRATRMRDLGQGTITDISDFRVRVAVVQANCISLRNALSAADRNFTLLTGLRGDILHMQVEVPPWNDPRSLDMLIDQVRVAAPAARTAQMNATLAEIAMKRVKAQYLPQVSAQVARVSLYRSDPKKVYTVEETRVMETAAPHLMQALAMNRQANLERLCGGDARAQWAAAIADVRGVLYHADVRFLQLVSTDWPGGEDNHVSPQLMERLRHDAGRVVGPETVVRRTLEHDVLYLKARPRHAVDSLSSSELKVVRLLVTGLTQKEVALPLKRSQDTVRTHVRNIFEKLDIGSAVMLSGILALRD